MVACGDPRVYPLIASIEKLRTCVAWLSMESIYTRRQFCSQIIYCGLLLRAVRLPTAPTRSPDDQQTAEAAEFEVLGAAMDEIIPQKDGMPSASAAGGVQ